MRGQIRNIYCVAAVAAAIVVGLPTLAQAERGWSVGGGIGLTADPETFLMQFDAPYYLTERLSVGPWMQLGVTGGVTIFALAGNVRYDIAVGDSPVVPFVNGGLGFAHGSLAGVGGQGFLMEFGGGIAFKVNDNVSLESQMNFNVIPDGFGPGDIDNFYWSWQMLGARFHF